MSVPYQKVLAETALRINAIVGPIPTTLETNYIVSPLTTTQVASSIFPLTAIKDAVLNAEEKLAWVIADNVKHPWRQYLKGVTDPLPNLSDLPAESDGALPVIGEWGAVVDDDSGQICTAMPLDQVRRRVANANSEFVCPVYWFAISGGRIEHTLDNVVVECCTYSRSVQSAAFAAGDILLSDALEHAYVCGAVAMLMRDDEFMNQAAAYATYFAQALTAISQGLTGMPLAS